MSVETAEDVAYDHRVPLVEGRTADLGEDRANRLRRRIGERRVLEPGLLDGPPARRGTATRTAWPASRHARATGTSGPKWPAPPVDANSTRTKGSVAQPRPAGGDGAATPSWAEF